MTTFSQTRRLHLRTRALQTRESLDILWDRQCEDVCERLAVINRRFTRILCLGGGAGRLAAHLQPDLLVEAGLVSHEPGITVVCSEDLLPFADASFDLAISIFSLQTIEDLPGCLIQIRRVLVPDGLFIATIPGASSLKELRESLLRAEAEVTGAVAQRVGPMLDLQQAAGLLQRAGFAMPVADLETLTLSYTDPGALLADIRALGESNPILHARPLRRDCLAAALMDYQTRHAGPDGRIPATLEFVHLAGWAPGPDQPQPKARGSATVSMADALRNTRNATNK